MTNRSVLDWPKGVTVYKPDRCYNGFTVINPFLSRTVYLVNMVGDVVHQWGYDETDENGKPLYSVLWERQLGGALMNLVWRAPRHAKAYTRPQFGLFQVDWQGKILWRYVPPEGVLIHHDAERLANGNTMILGLEIRRSPEVCDNPVYDDFFREIDPQGRVVWEWFTTDHIDEFQYPPETRDLMRSKQGDLFHNNTVTVLPGNTLGAKDKRFRKGNILGSQRHLGLIYIVDRDTGEVVWQWGTGDGELIGQHHPTMLHNGNILIYDNGGRSGYPPVHRPKTRLVEIDPSTNRIVWEYGYEYNTRPSSKFFGSSWGSAQRLPNGNTVSLDTHAGRVFEVTPWGEVVWEYINPFPWNETINGQNERETEYGMYRVFRFGYEDFPEANPLYLGRDGYAGRRPPMPEIPDDMGLPSDDPA